VSDVVLHGVLTGYQAMHAGNPQDITILCLCGQPFVDRGEFEIHILQMSKR
jgi:hypothetical protein